MNEDPLQIFRTDVQSHFFSGQKCTCMFLKVTFDCQLRIRVTMSKLVHAKKYFKYEAGNFFLSRFSEITMNLIQNVIARIKGICVFQLKCQIMITEVTK